MNGNHSPEENVQSVRPTTATSVISQETGYPDDYGSSIDSRSLGRDSALGPYMSHGYYGAYRDTPDRPNPFVQGTAVGMLKKCLALTIQSYSHSLNAITK